MIFESKDYHDYVIKDGKFIGKFEEMYQNIDDPWYCGEAQALQYDLMLCLLDRINLKGTKVLDIGCGRGAFTARLRKQLPKAEILAVDVAPMAIKKAKRDYSDIDFRVMDIKKEYKKIKEKFDLIIMSGLMWYILPEFREIMNYLMENVLKKNGYFLTFQPFYKPQEQKYGNEIVRSVQDMLSLINLEPIEMIEINRLNSHSAIILFRT